MASSNFINIDWSSASQHSFTQLGNPIPLQNDSENLLHDTEPPPVLTTEDIFFLDIDDIYSFTYSTLHYEEPELEETDSINDYFNSLLYTPIEEITLRRDNTPSPINIPLPTVFKDNISTSSQEDISTPPQADINTMLFQNSSEEDILIPPQVDIITTPPASC
ncbi:unnamed protein product [Rhizophagus irregularis]|nr:unnamed protein product [Rhizophagus irregularis]